MARASVERPALTSSPFGDVVSCCISPPFGRLSTTSRQITYVLLTRAPLYRNCFLLARLACVRRAANVRSEPGSNSPVESCGQGPAKDPLTLMLLEHDLVSRLQCEHRASGTQRHLRGRPEGLPRRHTIQFSRTEPSRAENAPRKLPDLLVFFEPFPVSGRAVLAISWKWSTSLFSFFQAAAVPREFAGK